jgi:predicted lipid-binding transport protein (Tim44 family)
MRRVFRTIGGLLALVAILALALPQDAWARAGGGGSIGSTGSRSFSSPSRSYSAPSQPTSPITQPRPASPPLSQPSPMGGFWRSVAGGVAGGLLGGMLFRSLGFAGGFGGGGFGGGFGLFDLLLLAGIGYLIYWMVRRNRAREAPAGGYYSRGMEEPYAASATAVEPELQGSSDLGTGLRHVRQMDPGFDEAAFRESCTDAFFKIQAAWMRRDQEALRSLLTEEMQGEFRKQIETARAQQRINKLENITVRSVDLAEVWQEQGYDFATIRFLANLLDYTVDETTGKVVEGSDTAPVKFEERWTWVRPVGPNPWRLSAIQQAG